MVKNIFISVLVIMVFSCKMSKPVFLNPFKIDIQFSKDTVTMGDTLNIRISIKDTSMAPVIFYPNPIIRLMHDNGDFYYGFGQIPKIYKIRDSCNEINKSIIFPNEKKELKYTIKVDTSFFNFGENNVLAGYIFVPMKILNRKEDKLFTRYYSESNVSKIFLR